MAYSTETMEVLKAARTRKGLSQHELAKLVGVPQSHISKIESGAVDLRLSSLVALARALDLEVTLVPRKNLSAVNSIVRHGQTGQFVEADPSTARELTRLQRSLGKLAHKYPELKEVAQVQRRLRDISHFRLPDSYASRLVEIRQALESFYRKGKNHLALKMALTEVQELRNELAHRVETPGEPEEAKPLYSLEDDGHG